MSCTPARTCSTAPPSSASLEQVGNHPRANILYDPSHFVLQQLDYLAFIDIYHERIKAFHVKDAEFNPTGRQGVYSGYAPWVDRAGRFRSLGDGQVDFAGIFAKMAANDFDGWAVLEWECALKDSETGAREGAEFIAAHIIPVTAKAFDDFAAAAPTRPPTVASWDCEPEGTGSPAAFGWHSPLPCGEGLGVRVGKGSEMTVSRMT